jgi:hypothetical protein
MERKLEGNHTLQTEREADVTFAQAQIAPDTNNIQPELFSAEIYFVYRVSTS